MAARKTSPELTRTAAQAHEAALRAEQDVERLSLRGQSLRETASAPDAPNAITPPQRSPPRKPRMAAAPSPTGPRRPGRLD